MTAQFEYEERYKVTNPEETHQLLLSHGYELKGTESQIDHWFIPRHIMSPEEQFQWFDYENGRALRIREQLEQEGAKNTITAKQLIAPADHSSMTNHEAGLTVAGIHSVLTSFAEEFRRGIDSLQGRDDNEVVSYADAKRLIEQHDRKEYITLHKERSTYRHPSIRDVVIDVDVIPALDDTALGHYAAIEIEYTGDESLESAREVIRNVSRDLGYDANDILTKALPGQAIEYLAKF